MILDLILIIIFAAIAYWGWSHGILRMLSRIFIFLVSAVASLLVTPYLSGALERVLMPSEAKINLSNQLAQATTTTNNSDQLWWNFGLKQNMAKSLLDGVVGNSSQAIADRLASSFVGLVLFVILIIIFQFALSMVIKGLTAGMDKLPIVGTANHFCGLLAGIVLAYFVCFLVVSVLGAMAPFKPEVATLVKSSMLYGWISDGILPQMILKQFKW